MHYFFVFVSEILSHWKKRYIIKIYYLQILILWYNLISYAMTNFIIKESLL